MLIQTMKKPHSRQVFLSLSLSFLLAACATSPEDCDPRKVDSAIKSAICGPGFQKGKEDREEQADVLDQQIVLETSTADALDDEAALLAADVAALESRISSLLDDLEGAKSKLDRTSAGSRKGREDLAAAQGHLKELQAQVSKLEAGTTDEKEIAVLLKDIEMRKRVINDLVKVDVF